MKRSHLVLADPSDSARDLTYRTSSRTPRPRCSPVWRTPCCHVREPISNRAGTRPAPRGEESAERNLLRPAERPTRVGSIPPPRGWSASRSALAKVRHTRDPRDRLVSFGIVVGAGLPRPPRPVCQTHHEADALESPNIVWTSFMERPAVFNRSSIDTGEDVPERNSTFKRAWISRLMYQKTFGGQLAVVVDG